MCTHDTAVQVCSILQCAKIQDHIHTHNTCFGNTTGLPISVLNPTHTLPKLREATLCMVMHDLNKARAGAILDYSDLSKTN